MSLTHEIARIASVNLFKRNPSGAIETGTFVGRPFHLDYSSALLLVADAWKQKALGLPQGCFLLAYYENEPEVCEALLLRVIAPTKLPTDGDVISSMVEYYKDIVEFFVNFLTRKSDLVFDPFAGSNTTGACAEGLARSWISVEAKRSYITCSRGRFSPKKLKSQRPPGAKSSKLLRSRVLVRQAENRLPGDHR